MTILVDPAFGPVASWWFENPRELVVTHSPQELERLLQRCLIACDILERADLLSAGWVVGSTWVRPATVSTPVQRVERPDVRREIGRPLATAEVLPISQADDREGFLYPLDVTFEGSGVIFAANGEDLRADGVLTVKGVTFGTLAVEISTFADVWLPYGLDARPQPKVCARNAPRLEKALTEIARRLEMRPSSPAYTRYAVIEEYRLRNHSDADGHPLPVELLGDLP